MKPDQEIRLLKTQEIEAAVDLIASQLREHQLTASPDEIRSVIERIVRDDQLGFVLVAIGKSKKPVGIALGSAFLGVEHGGKSGWLEEFYVHPEFRGHGVGSRLLAEFVRIAKESGWRAIDLEVNTSHRRVMSLYKRHGFTTVDRSRFCRTLNRPNDSKGTKQ